MNGCARQIRIEFHDHDRVATGGIGSIVQRIAAVARFVPFDQDLDRLLRLDRERIVTAQATQRVLVDQIRRHRHARVLEHGRSTDRECIGRRRAVVDKLVNAAPPCKWTKPPAPRLVKLIGISEST